MIRVQPRFNARWLYDECVDKIRKNQRHELANIERAVAVLPQLHQLYYAVLIAAQESMDCRHERNDGLTFEKPGQIASIRELIPELQGETIAKLAKLARGGQRLGDRINRLGKIDRTYAAIKDDERRKDARRNVRVTWVTR